MAADKGKCPPATQDIAVNIKNRQNAIENAAYGPLNPKEPNEAYWKKKADRWDVSVPEAKKQRCGNCIMFVRTPTMLNCIESALGNEEGNVAWDIIKAGELGYCEAFDFKCAAERTCDAWVVGGPTVDEEKIKEKSLEMDFIKLQNTRIIAMDVKDDLEDMELPEWGEDYSDEALMLDYDEKSLKQWFKEKWVDISRPKPNGGFEPCGRDEAGKGKYPKCVPASKASKMSAEEIRSAVSRKRKAESTQVREDKKPINVSTSKKDASSDVFEKSAKPTDTELYARVKAEAKKKFDVYPSAYANAWLVREYKKRGGGYREEKELDGEYVEDVFELNEKQLHDFMDWMETKSARKPKRLKDPKGGLTSAGREYFKRTQGSNLKPGVKGAADTPEKMRRKGSFLTRFFTNPSGPMKDEKGRATRLALSAAAWGEPVPKNSEDAAALAAKGRRLLDRYENTKKKKK
jgi:hypothetical protein